ncbi:MAG: superoxide dismutase, partial [Mycobacteriales bacterium]
MTTIPTRATRRFALVTACTALSVAVGLPAEAARAHTTGTRFPARIELPNGLQPEGITAGRGTTLFAGSLANGAIWRVDAKTGALSPLVAGIAGRVAVGMDHENRANRLWVAGGPTAAVTVYDATTGAELARYTIAGAGFLNDLTVTRDAVYVTDSQVQRLVVIPLRTGAALPAQGAVFTLPLTGDIAFVAGAFNANGIVATPGGRWLIVVQTATSSLFRVDTRTGATQLITLTGGTLTSGDGLVLRGRTLYVVRGTTNAIVKIRLGGRLTAGRVVATLTAPGLDVPTTATFVAGRL